MRFFGLFGHCHRHSKALWDSVDDIDFDVLPEKFVMKTNHSGGNTGVVICRDKNKLDKELAISKLANSLSKHNIYRDFREWPYKNIKPKIFVEPLLESKEDPKAELTDYKFFCFDGHVDSVMICVDRQIGSPKFYFFDKDWQLRRYNKRGKEAPSDFTLPKPKNLDKMF
ncbi:MAG: hypothetical protein HUJ98_11945, partial [Bacteroidaceae bacterium]|nr:hypothetical protein [Bacteroidaceae bacterium]